MPDGSGLVMGVDVGTFETKGVITDAEGSAIAAAAQRHPVSTPRPGWVEHDAEHAWWEGLVSVARSLVAQLQGLGRAAGAIEALCVSGIGPTVLPTDRQGNPLRAAILYGVDTRAEREAQELESRLGGRQSCLLRCGHRLTTQSAGPKIAWLAAHEHAVHRKAHTFHTCQSFLVQRLTGQRVIDHCTASYFHPFYRPDHRTWDVSGLEDLAREDQLPELRWANEVAGRLRAEAARETGLPAGLPVLVGSADAPVEAFGCGVDDPSSVMLMYGSSGFVIAPTQHARPGAGHYSAPGLLAGSWMVAAGTSTAGTALRWYTDLPGPGLLPPDERDDADVFGALVRLAEESPKGASGVITVPHLSGERTPVDDPRALGIVAGTHLGNTAADLARSCVEGVAHSMVWALSTLLAAADADGSGQRRLVAIGGGTKNPVWLQAVSDISGLEQVVVRTRGACHGDARLAAITAGLTSAAQPFGWGPDDPRVQPDPEAMPAYREDHARFQQWYAAGRAIREGQGR